MTSQTKQPKPVIVVPASSKKQAKLYVDALMPWNAEPLVVTPGGMSPGKALERMDGLLLIGGADVHPHRYGKEPDPGVTLELDEAQDGLDIELLEGALARDIPVVAICRGMQLLNVVSGGTLIQHIPGHRNEEPDASNISIQHRIWIAPGSKLASVVGAGGQVRVNSLHHQGLMEAQRAPVLMTTAYGVTDGLVEALESPHHRFVVAVQCHPELADELPEQFQRLFAALVFQAANPAV
ncbi:MAG: gamma-glutamyl-gamma-aminobutyrate hydrolase family protein [SAR202 cluster bacterium]|nr:gamma-glutamyl-gamma-aminobutyrate hydrolase family protein [SAR202 cluster bacterium]